MNNGYVSSGLKSKDVVEAGFAATRKLDRSDGSQIKSRWFSGKQRSETPAGRQSLVERQFMRMSSAHDRIRMKLLAASLLRTR